MNFRLFLELDRLDKPEKLDKHLLSVVDKHFNFIYFDKAQSNRMIFHETTNLKEQRNLGH